MKGIEHLTVKCKEENCPHTKTPKNNQKFRENQPKNSFSSKVEQEQKFDVSGKKKRKPFPIKNKGHLENVPQ
jgi:hypothetical protein